MTMRSGPGGLRRDEAESRYMTGKLLIAMPGMRDIRFNRSVVYICAHSAEGAMGLVVNKTLDSLTLPELMSHLKIPAGMDANPGKVHFGGPVETARGFVLHSSDYVEDATMVIGDEFALTATLDVLRAIGRGKGPRQALLALGYASWSPGQLDSEIQANVWLQGPANGGIVFDPDDDSKWDRAIADLGIDARMLSSEAGHA
ncbi:MAG TPA: YqgE/AlgH family protein [Stellaceae bacterium]|nr:YqgE/AlgH family protein [Stellaceae bacterium]